MKDAVIHIQEVDGHPEIVEMIGEQHRVLALATIVAKVLAQSMEIPSSEVCGMMVQSLAVIDALREDEEEE